VAPQPNILFIMTDEERYPPPYEREVVAEFRRTQLPARERLRTRSVEFHRHYAASTACIPSRASLFTGQYPSLHGVTNTDGLAKSADDPAMHWLDPDVVPTLGDWFRAGGYGSHYRGKWHISHADLVPVGAGAGLASNDREGQLIPAGVDAYERADRLDRFGFSGWIGREPHGADPSDTGLTKDELYADQIDALFDRLEADAGTEPWLTVASLVNPHDIAFSGAGWELLGFPTPDDTVPSIEEPPSQGDSFDGRPSAQRQFKDVWPQLLYEQPTDDAYRRLYLWLHKVVDHAIGRIIDRLEASRFAEDTIIVFTSDHGDLMGAHGGLQQKWHNAFDEAIRVPLWISGPGITPTDHGVTIATSHVDLLPTLLGLASIERESAAAEVALHHIESQPLVGRDLSLLVRGEADEAIYDDAIYFMTEDEISRGLNTANRFTQKPYDHVTGPCKVESVIANVATGASGAPELWKLNRYYEAVDRDDGVEWELYNLTTDPEERTNRAGTAADAEVCTHLVGVLASQRLVKRRLPQRVN
jgi:arylsulfatase A-like enzyme